MRNNKVLCAVLWLFMLFAAQSVKADVSTQLRYRMEHFQRFNQYERRRFSEGSATVLHSLRADVTAERTWASGSRGLLQLRAATANGFGNADTAFKPGEYGRVHQAFVETRGLFGEESFVRLGRQELHFGGGLLVAPDDWDLVGNTFDGARVSTESGNWDLDAVAAWPSDPSTSGRDGFLAGFNARHVSFTNTETEYSLFYNRRPYLRTGAAVDQDLYTLGARLAGKLSPRWTLLGQAHYQIGKTTKFEPQLTPGQRQTIRAWHYMLGADFFASGRVFTNFGIEFSSGSGDDTGTADRYETFQQPFPANHNRFGAMDWFGPMNANIVTLYAFYKISPRVLGLVQVHKFRLESPEAAWFLADGTPAGYSAAGNLWPNGASAPSDAGTEWDFEWRFRTNGPATYHLGYSVYVPGNLSSVANWWNATQNASWAYLQITYDK